jgi:hypothetical protein
MTLSSSPTLTFSNGQAGGQYTLILKQDGTGGRTVTWPGSIKWAGGPAPILTSNANAIDSVNFTYDGSNYLGTYTLAYGGIPSTLLNDIVAYFKFDADNSNDATTNGYNGTDSNMTYGSSYGKINDGASFNGSNSKISLPSGIYSLGNGTGPYTINMWVYVTDLSTAQSLLNFWNGSGGGNNDSTHLIYETSHQFDFQRGYGASETVLYASTTVAANTWYMVTITYDGSTKTIYVDGSNVGSQSDTNSAVTASQGYLGMEQNNFYFSGYEDEVGIWSRALTSTEVSNLYNGGSGNQYPF